MSPEIPVVEDSFPPMQATLNGQPCVVQMTVPSIAQRPPDRTIHLDAGIAAVIEAAVRANCKSHQQEDAARKTALAVAKFVSEAGLAATVLPEIRRATADLEAATAKAERSKQELAALASPELLDDEARRIVALASTLMDVYSRPFMVPASHGPRFSEGPGVARDVLRSASYGVWAYATRGSMPLPISAQDDNPSA